MTLAPIGKEFVTSQGENIRSIIELRYALLTMDPKVFSSHASGDKNDFARWVEDVFEREDISRALRSVVTQKEMANLLDDFVKKGRALEEMGTEEKHSLEEIYMKSDELKDNIKELRASSEKITDIDQKFTMDLEKIKARFDNIQEIISELRKEGKDMFIPNLLTKNVLSKLRYLEFAENEEDLKNCSKLLDEINKEIEEAKDAPVVDVKKEIDDRLQKEKVFEV